MSGVIIFSFRERVSLRNAFSHAALEGFEHREPTASEA